MWINVRVLECAPTCLRGCAVGLGGEGKRGGGGEQAVALCFQNCRHKAINNAILNKQCKGIRAPKIDNTGHSTD